MQMRFRAPALFAAGFLFLIVAAGCGDGRKPVLAVTGEIRAKSGKPAAGAILVFHPVTTPPSTNSFPPTAISRNDGTFTPTTYSAEDGLPEGDYVVAVIWPDNTQATGGSMIGGSESKGGADRLKGRYNDPAKSPLRVRVRRGRLNRLSLEVD